MKQLTQEPLKCLSMDKAQSRISPHIFRTAIFILLLGKCYLLT